jgi:hypothetical protein
MPAGAGGPTNVELALGTLGLTHFMRIIGLFVPLNSTGYINGDAI